MDKSERTYVTIIVQILSHALELIYVQVICTYVHTRAVEMLLD